MIRIAHIQLLPVLAGAQRVCLDELQRLNPHKFERYLICSYPGPLTIAAEKLGIKCIFVSSLKREVSFVNDLKALWQLFRIMRKYNFDIVHTHSSKPGVLGRVAAKLSNIKLIVHTVHGFSFPIAKNKVEYYIFYMMERLGCFCGDLLICLNEVDKDVAISKLGVKPHNIHILRNGVDLDKFKQVAPSDKIKLKQQFGFKSDDLVIGMIGRLCPQKNPLILLEAFLRLSKTIDNLHVCFIGDGELSDSLKSFSISHNISERVNLMGWHDDTNLCLNSFDIFVLPSLWEGMPLSILEAQATSLPCVVSDIPGNNHLVTDGVNGFVFPSNDSVVLSEKLLSLILNSEYRFKLGGNARLEIERSFNIDSRVNTLIKIYEERCCS